jgi:hypothetical protein
LADRSSAIKHGSQVHVRLHHVSGVSVRFVWIEPLGAISLGQGRPP